MTLFNKPVIVFIMRILMGLVLLDIGNRMLLGPENVIQKAVPRESEQQKEESVGSKTEPVDLGTGSIVSQNQSSTGGDTLLFLYCESCGGYQKKFEDLRDVLKNEFKDLEFIGHPYPVKSSSKFIGNLIFALQICIFVFLTFGERIFAYFNMQAPPIYHQAVRYKMFVMLAMFFFGNHLSSILKNSGAFEVYFNESLIYSKLSTGTYPDYSVLKGLISEQMNVL